MRERERTFFDMTSFFRWVRQCGWRFWTNFLFLCVCVTRMIGWQWRWICRKRRKKKSKGKDGNCQLLLRKKQRMRRKKRGRSLDFFPFFYSYLTLTRKKKEKKANQHNGMPTYFHLNAHNYFVVFSWFLTHLTYDDSSVPAEKKDPLEQNSRLHVRFSFEESTKFQKIIDT